MSKVNVTLGNRLTTIGSAEGKNTLVKTEFHDPRQAMNPGELLANSLGACMLTMIGFLATRRGEKVEGTKICVEPAFDEKHSRMTGFTLMFCFPEHLTQTQKDFYAKAAESCPVHNSLREDMTYKIVVK